MAGKRSNPTELLRQKEEIVRDMENRLPTPTLGQKIGQGIESALRPLTDAVARKQLRKNPPPEKRGAKVTGFRQGPYPT